MDKTLILDIVTPERSLLTEEIQSLVVPATEGYMGILPNHAPIISGLKPGVIRYRQDGKKNFLSLSGGFMEISHNKITILADAAEKPEEIDEKRALAAKQRAQQRLKERPAGVDVARAEMALMRAIARLRVKNYLEK